MTKYSLLRVSALAVALTGAFMSAPAQAVEYVSNGGFDTGDLTGWVPSGNAGASGWWISAGTRTEQDQTSPGRRR